MRSGVGRTVYTDFVFSFYVAYILAFTSLIHGVGVVNCSVTKDFSILAFNWASSWAKFSFIAGLSQNAYIFFLASVFINTSFTQMSGFCTFEWTLLVGADVSLMILLFRDAIFGLCAAIWKRIVLTLEFSFFAFNFTKSITEFVIIIESFVNADIVLLASSGSFLYSTFDLIFSAFNGTKSFASVSIIIEVVT